MKKSIIVSLYKLSVITFIIFVISQDMFASKTQPKLVQLKQSLRTLKEKLTLLSGKLHDLKEVPTPRDIPTFLDTFLDTLKSKNPVDSLVTQARQLLETALPNLKSQGINIVRLFSELTDQAQTNLDANKDGLHFCGCVHLGKRIYLVLQLLNDIVKKHTNKTELYVHTDLGEDGCLQSYLLLYGLLFVEYKNVTINLINVSLIAKSEIFEQEAHEFAERFRATIKINTIEMGTWVYQARVKASKAPRSHSYTVVDASNAFTFPTTSVIGNWLMSKEKETIIQNLDTIAPQIGQISLPNGELSIEFLKSQIIIRTTQSSLWETLKSAIEPPILAAIFPLNDTDKSNLIKNILTSLTDTQMVRIAQPMGGPSDDDLLALVSTTRTTPDPIIYTLNAGNAVAIKYKFQDNILRQLDSFGRNYIVIIKPHE